MLPTQIKSAKISHSDFFRFIRCGEISNVENALNFDKLYNFILVNGTDMDGWNSIHICSAFGSPEILNILIHYAGDDFSINERTEYGYTPILLAAQYENLSIFKELLKYKPDLSLTDNGCKSIYTHLSKIMEKLDAEIRTLFDLGEDI